MSPQNTPIWSSLDAQWNRLGEALRCIEDLLRFQWHYKFLSSEFKAIRHECSQMRLEIEKESGAWACHRDVAEDPGHPQQQPVTDQNRHDLSDLVGANLSRARESLRACEESLRLQVPRAAKQMELLRYKFYQLEAVLYSLRHRQAKLQDAQLYVLLTESLASTSLEKCAEACIAGGAQIIQLREKEMEAATFYQKAKNIREMCLNSGTLLLINDRIDIAALVEADGVHQGQTDLSPAQARRILGPSAIVGLSSHHVDQARAAQLAGADYLGVGPVFETQTKLHREAVGLEYVRQAQECVDIPGFAIGSVNKASLPQVLGAGARRVAICTGIIAQDDIEASTRWFLEQLQTKAPLEKAENSPMLD